MWRSLPDLLDRVEGDRTIRVLLLQGAGERAFCTGNDTSEFEAIRADAAQSSLYNDGQRAVAERMARSRCKPRRRHPRHCLGAGWSSPCNATFVSRAPTARMGVPPCGSACLPAGGHREAGGRGGLAAARLLVLTGRSFAGKNCRASASSPRC
jgi:enoyl-CoA hydratase/carnithine racemase